MRSKQEAQKLIHNFRVRHAVEGDSENIITCIHLMNAHAIDMDAALEQSSRCSGDHGIDGWHFDPSLGELVIYQSKLSESKALVVKGLQDLDNSRKWLETVLITGAIDRSPANPCLYNLFFCLSKHKEEIKRITFVLISLFNENEIEDRTECVQLERKIQDSDLMGYSKQVGIKLASKLEEYDFDHTIARGRSKYSVTRLNHSTITLRKNANLDLAYIALHSLVELYRRRGDALFDKNVRLSLVNSRESKARLVHPMEMTFDLICQGKLSPAIFPFYHVGITLTSTTNETEDNTINLESPSIINGCQTITIAASYLSRLEKQNKTDAINLFKQIQVVAKVVTGTTDEELREITNSNNRQTPIENWQLFSNDPIHIEIEETLKKEGIFYERQKGKFEALMSRVETAQFYPNTNNTFLAVEELGQLIALCRRKLQWAAKQSEIFINNKNHDSIFDRQIAKYYEDMILCSNLYKAAKRALSKYISNTPVHNDEKTYAIFSRPIVKAHVHYVAMIHSYQSSKFDDLRNDYRLRLNKKASPNLVAEFESFYQKVVSKTKSYYLQESNNFGNDVSSKKLSQFVSRLCCELGIDLENGSMPFGERGLNWTEDESS